VNQEMLEMWGRWALATAKGQQQMNSMSSILQNGMQLFEQLGASYWQLWGTWPTQISENSQPKTSSNPWDTMMQMQQEWMQMLSSGSCRNDLPKNNLSRKVSELEQQVAAQGRILALLKAQLKIEDVDQNENFAIQLKELIERQNQQFKQLTTIFSDFFKERNKSLEGNEKIDD
jgi:predicted alpha/beta-fold hydrolase